MVWGGYVYLPIFCGSCANTRRPELAAHRTHAVRSQLICSATWHVRGYIKAYALMLRRLETSKSYLRGLTLFTRCVELRAWRLNNSTLKAEETNT